MGVSKDKTILIRQAIEKSGIYVVQVKGMSMSPMLVGGRDSAIITRIKEKPQKYDVILFEYKDDLVLHRIVALNDEGYTTKGDHNSHTEAIKTEAVIGVMSAFLNNGKSISVTNKKYKRYSKLIVDHYKLMRWIQALTEKVMKSRA